MADYVDNLTDAELRTKLAEYGFPVVPITATTRKVMAKKLKLLIENKNKINSDGRRSLAKYSSGEDSDTDVGKVDVKKDKNRRATTAGAMLPPASKLRKTIPAITKKAQSPVDSVAANTNYEHNSNTQECKSTTTTTRRLYRTQYSTVDDDYEYSDSDVEITEKNNTSPNTSQSSFFHNQHDLSIAEKKNVSPSGSTYFTSLNNLKTDGKGPNFRVLGSSGLRSSGLGGSANSCGLTSIPHAISDGTPTHSTPSEVSGSTVSSRRNVSALDNLNQIRARLSLTKPRDEKTTPSYERKTVFGTPTPVSSSSEHSTGETPYFSDFTRRLSQMTSSRTPGTNIFNFKNDIIKENETNGDHFSQPFVNRFTTNRTRDMSKEFKKSQEKNIFKNNVVSFTLVGIACVFFLALSFLYMGMRNDQAPILDIADEHLPYCDDSLLSKPGVTCIKKESVPDALTLLKIIQPELSRKAALFKCGDEEKILPYMSERNILEYVKKHTGFNDEFKIKEDLYNLQVLVLHKDLGISLIETNNVYKLTGDEPVQTNPECLVNRATTYFALMDQNPDLSIKCLLYLKLHTVVTVAIIIATGGLVLFLGHYGFKLYMETNRDKNKKMFEMVEQIIDILSRNIPNENGDNFLAVSHIRDMLIPVQDRKKMASVWNAAVQFVNNSESRVRCEVQIVAGEEYHVWRWLGTPAMNLSGNFSRGKVWQGQAFETQEGSVNSLPVSPTQCLKIRHMFDKNEAATNWTTIIKDAILEKCGDDCKILHIGIDKATCCVYVKCATQSDAGLAYRNLHGWWYDGKLLTVKYLRLERYIERFPDSPSCGPFLKPSNNKKLSL